MAAIPIEARLRWQQYFMDRSHGSKADFVTILTEARDTNQSKINPARTWDNVPTLRQLTMAFAKCKSGKAAGEYNIVAEALRLNPPVLARIYHPLYVKVALRIAEPLQWRGNMISELWKRKGSQTMCPNYRDIAIGDVVGKVNHRLLRQRLHKYLAKAAGYHQFAGVGTDFPAHIVREIIALARRRQMSLLLLFLDIAGAFDSVLRQLTMPGISTDVGIARLTRQLGFGPEVMHELAQHLQKPTALEHNVSDQHLLAQLADVHSHNWFTTQGVEDPATSERGSRAGDPLGDLVFEFLHAKISKEVRDSLTDQGLITDVILPVAGGFVKGAPAAKARVKLQDVQFVDDVVHPLVHNDPHKLLHMVKAMVPVIVDIYAAHGMKLNFSQGKSEAILALRGKGSKALKAKLAETTVIPIKTAALGKVDLRIVDRYKHLGGIVTAGGTMLPEVLARSDSSTTAFLPLANKVFCARWLPSQTRTSLAKSLIYSRLLHNASTWPSLPTSATAKVHATYMKPLRRITGDVRHAGATSSKPDREIIKQLCMPSAACAVMTARLRYAARVDRFFNSWRHLGCHGIGTHPNHAQQLRAHSRAAPAPAAPPALA